jgi:hypothetical protein
MAAPASISARGAATLRRRALRSLQAFVAALPFLASAQQPSADLAGMWSDPPATPEDAFCFFSCTDAGLEYLAKLLDDRANDARPYRELSAEASKHQLDDYILPRLTPAARASYPLDPLKDPGYLHCEPWGFAQQVLAPHQLAIEQLPDRVLLHYGEWDAKRTVYMDGKDRPEAHAASPLGYSVGHYEGAALVVETSAIAADRTAWEFEHSADLRAVERYTRLSDGKRLQLELTLRDPWGLREPLTVKKIWAWAPDQQIFAYDACEPAAKDPDAGKTP